MDREVKLRGRAYGEFTVYYDLPLRHSQLNF